MYIIDPSCNICLTKFLIILFIFQTLGYKIVIICSKEEEEKSNIISKLQIYRRPNQLIHSDKSFLEFLKSHIVHHDHDTTMASQVDSER